LVHTIVIHKECNIIINELKKELENSKISYHEIHLTNSVFSDLYKVLKHGGALNNTPIIICHPITGDLLVKLAIILSSKPRKIVLLIPPNPKHKIDSTYVKIILYLLRTMLTFMENIGVKQLLVFTTPYERLLLDEIIRETRYVFFPTYAIEKPGFNDLVFSEKPVISFFVLEQQDIVIIKEALDILEELGFKPFFILGYANENIRDCIDDYRVMCIHTEDIDNLIKYSTITVVKTPTPETNSVILKSILYFKPVITTLEHGIALYYRYTGLIFLQRKWDGEALANSIIEVLNNLDNIKKKSLTMVILDLKKDFGSHIITRFLKSS